jgi:hypothetical protein
MKKLLLGSLVLLMFSASIILFNISCNKESDAQQTTNCIGPQPILQFKGNGVLYECKGINDARVGWVGYPKIWKSFSSGKTFYNISFSNYKTQGDFDNWTYNYPATANTVSGWIAFETPTFGISTYTNTDDAIGFDNLDYGYELNKGRLIFTITSMRNGLVSGTFSGILPATATGNYNRGPLMNITEGVFANIPVFE